MKKLIKNWWPLLLIAVYWIVKRSKRNPVNTETPTTDTPTTDTPAPFPNTVDPFQGGACIYGSPTMYSNN